MTKLKSLNGRRPTSKGTLFMEKVFKMNAFLAIPSMLFTLIYPFILKWGIIFLSLKIVTCCVLQKYH